MFRISTPYLYPKKESIFKFKTIEKNSRFTKVSICLFEIIFCPTSWLMLKRLDNPQPSALADNQNLGLDNFWYYTPPIIVNKWW